MTRRRKSVEITHDAHTDISIDTAAVAAVHDISPIENDAVIGRQTIADN